MTILRRPAPKPILIVVAAFAVAAASYGWAAFQGARQAGISTSALTDPAALAGHDGRMSLNDQISFWAGRVKRTPADFLSLTQLALAEASKAKLTADLGLYELAQRQIGEALAIDSRYGAGLRTQAQLRFALHDFGGAIVAAQAALGRDPRDDGARGILGDAQLELGRITDATATYGAFSPASHGPAVEARLAHLALVTGRIASAMQLAQEAYQEALTEPENDITFYAYQLGETARQAGDPVLARIGFEAALASRPTDLGSLVGLARVDASAGHREAAIAGLRRAAAIAPQPETLALLGDLLQLGGDSAAAAAQYQTVRAIETLGSTAETVYDRQLVLFELDHGGATEALLAHAQAALASRPDATGHDVVAWALYRLGRFDAALAESRLALTSGTQDARILAHAGAIALAIGDVPDGLRDARAALALGPAIDPLTRSEITSLLAGR